MKKKSKQKGPTRLGRRITEGLTELRDVLQRGEQPDKHFRVNTIEIPEPPPFTAMKVRALRQRLRLTQGIFARLLGVSVELVEHWEQGIRTPRPMARRLLNEIDHDPDGFMKRLPHAGKAA